MSIEKFIDKAGDVAANAVDATADKVSGGVESAMDWFANIIDPPSKPEPDSRPSDNSNCPPCGK